MGKINIVDASNDAIEENNTPLDEAVVKKPKKEPAVIETKNTKIVVNNWEDELDEEDEPPQHPEVPDEDLIAAEFANETEEAAPETEENEDEWHVIDEEEPDAEEDEDDDLAVAAAAVNKEASAAVLPQSAEPEVEDVEVDADTKSVEGPAEDESETPVDDAPDVAETDGLAVDEEVVEESEEIQTDDSIIKHTLQDSEIPEAATVEGFEGEDTVAHAAEVQAALDRADSIAVLAGKSAGGSYLARIKQKVRTAWRNKKIRYGSLGGLFLVIALMALVPAIRFAVLNTFGVRASAQVVVLDAETKLPLKQVTLAIGDTIAQTDTAGRATFDGIRLGSVELTTSKPAYADTKSAVTINTGKNELSSLDLAATGTSFRIQLQDWLSEQGLEKGEVEFEQNAAYINDQGLAILNIPPTTESSITVAVLGEGYANATIDIDTTSEETSIVPMVLARRHVYVSNSEGTYDVIASLADGSDKKTLLSGTGSEKDELRFGVSPSGKKAVLAATRDPELTNSEDFILSGFFVIDTDSGEFEQVDASERIDIVGWIDESVIYVKVEAGASGQNPERHRLMSYNTATDEGSQIAASNYFNDVLVANDYVFYAPSDAYKQNPKPFLYRSNVDGSEIETVLQKNVWTVIRTGIDAIAFDSNQQWYEGKIDTIINSELDSKPENVISKLYTVGPRNSTAWVDIRDGQGSLILIDSKTGEETTLVQEVGLRNPLVWLDDTHLIYRIVTPSETADYIISTVGDNKEPVKIGDVSDVSGADRWYYYY